MEQYDISIADIMEGIEYRYKNDEPFIAQIYAYLFNDFSKDASAQVQLRRWLDHHNYCSHCGASLKTKIENNYHSEVGVNEKNYTYFCSECGNE